MSVHCPRQQGGVGGQSGAVRGVIPEVGGPSFPSEKDLQRVWGVLGSKGRGAVSRDKRADPEGRGG